MTVAENYIEYLSELGSVDEAGPNRRRQQQRRTKRRQMTTRERQKQAQRLKSTGYREYEAEKDKAHALQQAQTVKASAKSASIARRQRLRDKFAPSSISVSPQQSSSGMRSSDYIDPDGVIRQERIAQARRRREAANRANELARQKADAVRARAEQAREQQQRANDAQPNRTSIPPAGPPDVGHAGRFGGTPEYDYSNTNVARGGREFAAAVSAKGSQLGTYARAKTIDKYKSRRALRRKVTSKKAKRRIPKQALREIESIISLVPKPPGPDSSSDPAWQEYHSKVKAIRNTARFEEDDIQDWREEEVEDIKSFSRAVAAGWKAGKKRARKVGRSVATSEIVGAIPRAYQRYRHARDQEKEAARQHRDYERREVDNRTRSLDRRVDQNRVAYLRELKTKVLNNRWNDLIGFGESLSPFDILEGHKHTVASRRRENQRKVDRKRLRGISRNIPSNEPDKKNFSHVKGDEDLSGGIGKVSTKVRGGKRKKRKTTKRFKSSSYHTNVSTFRGGKYDSSTDIGPSETEGRNINPSTGKIKRRYYSPQQINKQRHAKILSKRRNRNKGSSYEPYKRVGEMFGDKPMVNTSMVQRNVALQSSKKDKPQKPMMKPVVKQRSSYMKESKKHDYYYDDERSSLTKKAKKAAGAVAKATGADELAHVPGRVHQNIKRHFVHNFLLR